MRLRFGRLLLTDEPLRPAVEGAVGRFRSAGPALALVLAAAAWGTGTVVSKRAVDEFPPPTLLAIQLAASLVILVTLMRLRGVPVVEPGVPSILGRLGIVNPGIAYGLSLMGLTHLDASLSVLLWALEPILILVLAAWLLSERIGRPAIVLSAVAVAGTIVIAYRPGETGNPLGVALTIAGVVCCAVYTIVTRRWIGASDGTASVVASQQAHALVVAGIFVVALRITGEGGLPGAISPLGWASAIGSGVLYYAVAYWLYLSALRTIPAPIAAASFYLVPVFGIGASIAFLGERLDGGQWLGVSVVALAVAGILRTTGGRRSRAAVPQPAG